MSGTVLEKTAVEFGKTVTLYRVVDSATGKGTLWHRNLANAWRHFRRMTVQA